AKPERAASAGRARREPVPLHRLPQHRQVGVGRSRFDVMTATDSPATTPAIPAPVVGTRMIRKEDARLLTGEAKYVDDIAVPGALRLAVVRSPYAHARIRSVDVSQALAQPGVVAAFTGADLRSEWAGPMPCPWPVTDD